MPISMVNAIPIKIHIDIWFKEQSKTLELELKTKGMASTHHQNIYQKIFPSEPMLNESGRGLNIKALSDGIKFYRKKYHNGIKRYASLS